MGITKEDILNAANALERDNEKITMETVRDFLGGGSYATISPVLREWKESRKSQVSIVIDMPIELKKTAERMEAEFWQVASGLANERLVTVQAEADTKVEEAHIERDETLKEVSRLEAEIETLTTRKQELKEQLGAKEEKIAELEKALLTQRTQSEQLLTQYNALLETNKENVAELKHLSSVIQGLEKENAIMAQKVETAQATATETKIQSAKEIKDLSSVIQELEKENAVMAQKVETAQATATETKIQSAKEIKDLSSVIQELEKENAVMAQKVETAQAAAAETKIQSAKEIEDLITGHKDTIAALKEATDKATVDLKESHAKIVSTIEQNLKDAQKQRDEAKAEATAVKKKMNT